MFIYESHLFLIAGDLAAFTSHFPDVTINVDAPLKIRLLGKWDVVDFGEQAAALSQEAKVALTQVALSFVKTRRIPDWLQDAQRTFSSAVQSVLKAQEDVLLFDSLIYRVSLHDPAFDETAAKVEESTGHLLPFHVSVFSPPFSDQDLEGRFEINPEYFTVSIWNFGSNGSKIAKIRDEIETLFRNPHERLSGNIENVRLAGEKKNFYRLHDLFRLDPSSFLSSLVADLNAPSTVTGEITRNMLVSSLAGTEPQAAFDVLGAYGLKTLAAPPFKDRNRVDKMYWAANIMSRQFEETRQEMNEASSRNPGLFAKLGAMRRKQARRDKEIAASWPATEYRKLCVAIGLRP